VSLTFAIIAAIVLTGAIGLSVLRKTVHCVLSLTIVFFGLAMLYIRLDAPFLGFALVLIYVSAVTILILFTVLLTRNREIETDVSPYSRGSIAGLIVGGSVFAGLVWMIYRAPLSRGITELESSASVKSLGERLMTEYVLPLEVIALLLTAAMIGAVIVAMKDPG